MFPRLESNGLGNAVLEETVGVAASGLDAVEAAVVCVVNVVGVLRAFCLR